MEGVSCGQNNYCDVGGIVGWSEYKESAENEMISNCINKGDVISSYFRVGGIAGYSNQNFANCENEGSVQGKGVVGGIVGWWAKSGSITKCKNSGDISGEAEIGGLVGGISVQEMVQFMNSKNSGKVTGNERVGGLVGASFATIDEDLLYTCSNTGEIVCGGTKNEIYNKLNK